MGLIAVATALAIGLATIGPGSDRVSLQVRHWKEWHASLKLPACFVLI